MKYFVHIQEIFIINCIFLLLISFLRFFRGWNDPQVLQQWNNGQMNIKIANQCIKSGHQSQQSIEIWWKSMFRGPYFEVFKWSQNLNFGTLLPICSFSYSISRVLGPGDHFNPLKTLKMRSGTEKSNLWWILPEYVQNIWKKWIFLTIFKRPYFWTGIWFFQSVKI